MNCSASPLGTVGGRPPSPPGRDRLSLSAPLLLMAPPQFFVRPVAPPPTPPPSPRFTRGGGTSRASSSAEGGGGDVRAGGATSIAPATRPAAVVGAAFHAPRPHFSFNLLHPSLSPAPRPDPRGEENVARGLCCRGGRHVCVNALSAWGGNDNVRGPPARGGDGESRGYRTVLSMAPSNSTVDSTIE